MASPQLKLQQRLGLLDATTIVMGSMIGSGIFIVSADIARQVQSPGLLILTWAVTALLTIIGALSYGELAAAMPRAGGQYIYLREAFNPLAGFLFGWTFFLVIQTGTIAAVAVAFAKFTGVFFPAISAENRVLPFLSTQQITGIAVILLLTWINMQGVKIGATIQNVFTIAKTGALIGLIGVGFLFGRDPGAMRVNFDGFWQNADWSWTAIQLIGVASVGSLFSSDAWNNVTFTAGETRNPERNLPLSLALGVGVVSLLYLTCNFVYLSVLPLSSIQTAAQDRVGTAVVERILGGQAAGAMAAAIMVSTFGCANGLILAGARVYYAMALDGLFFQAVGRLDPRKGTPVVSLAVQCAWACLLTLSGQYNELLDYVIFAVLLFYILTIIGLFVLRRTQPDLRRPYRAIGYPVLPAVYVVIAGIIEILLLMYKPKFTWPGLGLVLTGIPVYFLWKSQSSKGRKREVTA